MQIYVLLASLSVGCFFFFSLLIYDIYVVVMLSECALEGNHVKHQKMRSLTLRLVKGSKPTLYKQLNSLFLIQICHILSTALLPIFGSS